MVFGDAPLGRQPALDQHAVERGIQRAVLDPEALARSILDSLDDSVSVKRAAAQGPQDQQIERPREQLRDGIRFHVSLSRLGINQTARNVKEFCA